MAGEQQPRPLTPAEFTPLDAAASRYLGEWESADAETCYQLGLQAEAREQFLRLLVRVAVPDLDDLERIARFVYGR